MFCSPAQARQQVQRRRGRCSGVVADAATAVAGRQVQQRQQRCSSAKATRERQQCRSSEGAGKLRKRAARNVKRRENAEGVSGGASGQLLAGQHHRHPEVSPAGTEVH
ncbi:hypothetical protein Taro_039973 [Colocasia esculenta]|uniref:Uncharacterized protein n=1 Tax=Colocasia esculenta TaxID=4460 RepID=A0A843WX75_COLES|nr:hypothetical protein [Colocasia esculenta]